MKRAVTFYRPETGEVAQTSFVHLPLGVDPDEATEDQWRDAIIEMMTSMALPCVDGIATEHQVVIDRELVDVEPKPTMFHEFDLPSRTWVDPRAVALLSAERWNVIKQARAAALAGGVEVGSLGRFDADDAAKINVAGVFTVLSAMPDDWTVEWTRFDNTRIALSKDEFRAVAMVVLEHVMGCHATSQALRDALSAATTPEHVAAVSWPT